MVDGEHVELWARLTRGTPLGGKMQQSKTVGSPGDGESELGVMRQPVERHARLGD
jgi:hypothetical protein